MGVYAYGKTNLAHEISGGGQRVVMSQYLNLPFQEIQDILWNTHVPEPYLIGQKPLSILFFCLETLNIPKQVLQSLSIPGLSPLYLIVDVSKGRQNLFFIWTKTECC